MSYTVRYNQPTRAERYAAALNDAREYLGADGYASVMNALQAMLQHSGWRHYVRDYPALLAFVGVQGVAACAMAHEACKSL